MRAIDIALLGGALYGALLLRFDGEIPPIYLELAWISFPFVIALQYASLMWHRVPSFAWKYVGLREAVRIFTAVGAASAVVLLVRLLLPPSWVPETLARALILPVGVILIDFVLAFLAIVGVRALRRLSSEWGRFRSYAKSGDVVPTILVGAGEAGLAVAKEVKKRPDLGIALVGFVDDDPEKIGRDVHGYHVLGPTAELAAIARRTGAREAIITLRHPKGDDVRRIRELCSDAGLSVRIIPSMFEILDGRMSLDKVREVSIEDLLGRAVVELADTRLELFLKGRTVMVTGAGGSIGSEISRQVARFGPAKLVLLDRSEPQLFSIHAELTRHGTPGLVASLTDLGDAQDLDAVLEAHSPHVIFHAAAYKHVPLLESNATHAVKNNVLSTYGLVEAAEEHGVETFVMLSTDKAVNPTSVMGATKRLAEKVLQAKDPLSLTKFVSVRFGNVLGSTGSVVPIFKEQIAAGGPVSVTHPEMRRYFMTISEAAQLVLVAGSMGLGGEIFLLDMGEPVRIVDLAEDLIRLSGFVPGEEIAVEFTGVRPGEKLFEELGFDPKKMEKTLHSKIFVLSQEPDGWNAIVGHVRSLERAIRESAGDATFRQLLENAIPGMHSDARGEVRAATPERHPTHSG